MTKQGAPAGACLCLNVFPSRAVLPSRQRGHPVATRRAPVLVARAVPPKRAPSRGRGGSQLVSDRRSFGTWRATCRALLPTSSGDPTAREPVRFGRGQPWEPRLQAHPPSSKGGQTSTFSRAEQPYRRCSAAPHFAPGACLGSRAGCPASTTPLTRAGQPPRRNQGARRRAVPRPHDVLWPAGSQARDLAGPPGTKADEARLLGGGGGGPHRCPRPGVESCRPPVSGPSTKEGDVNPPVTSGSATKIALVTAMLDGRVPVQPLPR